MRYLRLLVAAGLTWGLLFYSSRGAAAGSASRDGQETAPKAAANARVKLLTPEQAIKRWMISDLQFSPDGSRLAMVVSEPLKGTEQKRNIWIYNLALRKLQRFTTSQNPDSRPRWSPDGKTLAFLANRTGTTQVYLLPVDGGEAQPLTESKTAVSSFEWSPDGKRIAFDAAAAKTEEEEKKEKEKDDARVVDRDEKNPELKVIDIDTKEVKTVIQGAWRFSEYIWLPDGKRLAAIATDQPQRELFSDKIFSVDVDAGKMTVVAAPRGPFSSLKVSPDGKLIAYVGSRLDGPSDHDLCLQPVAGGAAQNLTADSIDRPVNSFCWTREEEILLSASAGFSDTFFRASLDGKAEKIRWPEVPVSVFGSFAEKSGTLAFVGESAILAPELWILGGLGQAEKLTEYNKDWDEIKLVKPEMIRYRSFDGLEIEAALLKPESMKQGMKLPLVVLIHGGPTGAWTDRINAWGQLLAARGFGVFYPNIRGSTGYGHAFMIANRKDWGGGDFKDIMAGLDDLVKRGIADPERLGIAGWSYGGYMAAWAVTQTQRFKAAVSGAPMTDLALEYGAEASSINFYDTWFLGTPYENLDLFIARSPVTHIKKVKTPTMILCGENDTTDPIEQCYQFHRGLKRYGVETEFVAYPREGHGIREEKHQVDMLSRIVGWFEKHLK